jgi:hypothetical protein
VFENILMKRISGLPEREEVTWAYRKLHNEGFIIFTLPQILLVIKSRRMRWIGHASRMVKIRQRSFTRRL